MFNGINHYFIGHFQVRKLLVITRGYSLHNQKAGAKDIMKDLPCCLVIMLH